MHTGIDWTKTRTTEQKVATHKIAIAKGRESSGADPARFLAILCMKVYVLKNLLAFGLAVCDGMRDSFELACVPKFPHEPAAETHKNACHGIYALTVAKLRQSLVTATAGDGGPILHADLRTSRTSNEKLVGESRVHESVGG